MEEQIVSGEMQFTKCRFGSYFFYNILYVSFARSKRS